MINVITSFAGGWILKRLAEGIVDRVPGTRLVDEEDRDAIFADDVDLNYYVNDWCLSHCGHNKSAKTVVFLDHPKGDRYLKQADHIIAMAPQYARYAREALGKDTHLIIQPTDTQTYTPKLRLGFIGRFVGRVDYGERKGRDMIEHVKRLPYVDLRMTLGEVPAEELPEFYRDLDYVLVVSRVEGGPMCLTEGLACGIKVICPHSVGIAEMFREGVIDYKQGDMDSLTAVLGRLYAEKLRLHNLVKEYTWDKWAAEHARIFSHLLRRRNTCLYTTAIGDYGRALGKISLPLMRQWAALHGYRFHAFTDQGDHVTPSWVRMEMGRHMRAKEYKYGIYLDLDTAIHPQAPDIIDVLPEDGWDIAAWNHGDMDGWNPQEATRNITDYCEYAGLDMPQDYNGADYFNAGVMVVTDRYVDWEPGWKESPHGCQDQNALNLAVLRGDLRWHRLGREWNYGHVSSIPPDIYNSVHVVHCNQPTLAPCQMSGKREQLLKQAAAIALIHKRVNVQPKGPRILMATVVQGEAYDRIYEMTRGYHEAYAKAHGWRYKVIRKPRKEWPSPSWWKMELYDDLDDYEAVVMVDCDAWPWPGSRSIVGEVPQGKFGATNSLRLDYMADKNSTAMQSYRSWNQASGIELYDPAEAGFYCNCGVFVCWRDARRALQAPEACTESAYYFEQHQVNWNLYSSPGLYYEIGQEWNCCHMMRTENVKRAAAAETQIVHVSGVPVFYRPKLIGDIVDSRSNQQGNAPAATCRLLFWQAFRARRLRQRSEGAYEKKPRVLPGGGNPRPYGWSSNIFRPYRGRSR